MKTILDLVAFLEQYYLNGYIRGGGSKLKLFTSRDGGKVTEVLKSVCARAREKGYSVTYADVAAIPRLHAIHHIYQALVREVELDTLVKEYCLQLIKRLGYEEYNMEDSEDLVTWAASRFGRVPEILRREIRGQLEQDLFRNLSFNRSFSTAILHLSSWLLGARENSLSREDADILYSWLKGEDVALKDLRRFHIFTKVDRYNARSMLRSLAEFTCLANRPGLVLALDKLEVLAAKQPGGRPMYNKSARNEFYESLRQLIDGLETLSHVLIIIGFQRELVDDEIRGLRSYEALWLRIQHEIESSKPNLFRDFIDLDVLKPV